MACHLLSRSEIVWQKCRRGSPAASADSQLQEFVRNASFPRHKRTGEEVKASFDKKDTVPTVIPALGWPIPASYWWLISALVTAFIRESTSAVIIQWRKKQKQPFVSFLCHIFGKQGVAEKTKAGQWPEGGENKGIWQSDTLKTSIPQLLKSWLYWQITGILKNKKIKQRDWGFVKYSIYFKKGMLGLSTICF